LVVLPLAATVVAVFFVLRTASAARASNAVALELWSFAILQFAVASAALAWGVAFGWSPAVFRVFYLFGAVVNVVWLALGTIWLLAPRTVAAVALAVVAVATGYAAYAVLTASFVGGASHALALASIPAPSKVMPGSVRVLSRWYSIGGSLVVIGGLAWSLLRRRRHTIGLALLAGGVVIVGLAGEFARAGLVAAFSALLAAGIAVMYAGFARTQS
jgi:hypothetical protein